MAQDLISDSRTPQSWKLTEDFGKFVSLITAVLLVLSTAYDLSFLYALGITFEELPTTLADHVRSAIVWVPRALLYVAVYMIYEMFMSRVEGGMSEEELIARSRTPRFVRTFRKSSRLLFVVLIPMAIAVDFFLGTSAVGLFLLATLTWGTLSFYVVAHPRLGTRFTSATRRLFVLAPLVVIWVAHLGYAHGDAMMRASTPIWKVEIKGISSSETRSLVGLRRFSQAAILIEPGRHVSVVPAESIVRAEALRAPDADIPRICRWFGAGCVKPIAVKQ